MTDLRRDWPAREAQLRSHVASGGFVGGNLEEATERVWIVAQMYLLFLDNGDHDFDVNDRVRKHFTDLANKRPSGPIDQEVMAWMPMYLQSMTRFEISLALCCVADRVGSGLVLSGAFDDNLADFVAQRDRLNPSLAARDTTRAKYLQSADNQTDDCLLASSFEFDLPCGLVDSEGRVHRDGVMRLATSVDEAESLRDPAVRDASDPFLTAVMLARVITRLGSVPALTPEAVAQLTRADIDYLVNFYSVINFGEDSEIRALVASVRDARKAV